ncbi:MAG: CPBP family intramembrane metalloprotease [Clostridiales bacterium]|nr:CPBP family intramembrane metalloprotease [Clostridiales bacterium]
MTVFNRPSIIDEAAAASISAKKGKKPGLFIVLEFLVMLLVFFIGIIAQSVAVAIADIPYNMRLKMDPSVESIMGLSFENYLVFDSLLCTAAMTAVVLLFIRIIQRRKIRTAGFVKKNALKHYLIGLLIGSGMFAVSIGICVMLGALKISCAGGFSPYAMLILFLGWMIQGNSEEVMCRGYLLVSVSRRYNVAVGVLFNSLIFGALHLGNNGVSVLPIVNIVLFGIVMSLVFLKTGNIWMVSAMHTSWNFVQGNVFGVLVSGGSMGDTILLSKFTEGRDIINGGDFGLEGGLAVTLVLIITIVILSFIKPCKEA